MKIAFIGSRGYPFSYASAEDMVREFGPRFVRDGHEVTVHCWATEETRAKGVRRDVFNGIRRVFHMTPGGKISGQFFVALKSSIQAAKSDCDIVAYIFINSAIFSWIPKLAGKKVFVNVDGIMWKDPKWPWGVRHVFFPLGAYLAYLVGDRIITDSYNMQALYKGKFRIQIAWCGYGCASKKPEALELQNKYLFIQGYYLIMSRITPHNLTDVMVDGFIQSGSKSQLLIAGHTPDTPWFRTMRARAEGRNVTFLGLVRDQSELNQLILHARAYLHGHSLGGINPALVRVTGMDTPAICVDTVFNREVVETPNRRLQACVFEKNPDSLAAAIRKFESNEMNCRNDAAELGQTIRSTMSWEIIYQQYKHYFEECCSLDSRASEPTHGETGGGS
jgi:glycosyltransferase involved in cell wall biosynthesis